MPKYDLSGLGPDEFERLSQSLIKAAIGVGSVTFGDGPDGGREATFSGAAPYPSAVEQWSGEWIFQAKFYDISLLGVGVARRRLMADLEAELKKITIKYKRPCDNYVLVTNVPLSSVARLGTHDRISQIGKRFKSVQHVAVWGADDVERLLETHRDIRTAYAHFVTPGDVIAQLLNDSAAKSRLAETMRAYLRTKHQREQLAQLVQAGDVYEAQLPLRSVFIDLDVELWKEAAHLASKVGGVDPRLVVRLAEKPLSVLELLITNEARRVVVVGGPGEGKSTIGQYLCQAHRAAILGIKGEPGLSLANAVVQTPRIPFRVALKDLAQWVASQLEHEPGASASLDEYLARDVSGAAASAFSTTDIHTILNGSACLLVLDGLDEIADSDLRRLVLERVWEFVDRCESVYATDLQVLGTSRPNSYTERFDLFSYLHVQLIKLDKEHVDTYVERWLAARLLDDSVSKRVREVMEEVASDPQVELLLSTPLQVTFVLFIIVAGGTPPREREGLFDEYVDTVYRREAAKAKGLVRTSRALLIDWHKYVGYLLHRQAAGTSQVEATFTLSELQAEAFEFLTSKNPYASASDMESAARVLVDDATKRIGLIVEPSEEGRYGFQVRSFQEFFAAAHLTDSARDSLQRLERFRAIALASHWRNVALLVAGRMGRQFTGESAGIVEICRDIDRAGKDRFLRRGSRLALELVADRVFGPNQGLQRSAVEVGLGLLGAEIGTWKERDVNTPLLKLSTEDVAQHVQPVLRALLEVTPPSLAGRVADVSAAVVPALLAPSLDLMSESGPHGLWAGARALEAGVLTGKTRTAIKRAAPKASPGVFAGTLSAMAREKLDQLLETVPASGWTPAQVLALLGELATSPRLFRTKEAAASLTTDTALTIAARGETAANERALLLLYAVRRLATESSLGWFSSFLAATHPGIRFGTADYQWVDRSSLAAIVTQVTVDEKSDVVDFQRAAIAVLRLATGCEPPARIGTTLRELWAIAQRNRALSSFLEAYGAVASPAVTLIPQIPITKPEFVDVLARSVEMTASKRGTQKWMKSLVDVANSVRNLGPIAPEVILFGPVSAAFGDRWSEFDRLSRELVALPAWLIGSRLGSLPPTGIGTSEETIAAALIEVENLAPVDPVQAGEYADRVARIGWRRSPPASLVESAILALCRQPAIDTSTVASLLLLALATTRLRTAVLRTALARLSGSGDNLFIPFSINRPPHAALIALLDIAAGSGPSARGASAVLKALGQLHLSERHEFRYGSGTLSELHVKEAVALSNAARVETHVAGIYLLASTSDRSVRAARQLLSFAARPRPDTAHEIADALGRCPEPTGRSAEVWYEELNRFFDGEPVGATPGIRRALIDTLSGLAARREAAFPAGEAAVGLPL